MQAEAQTYSTGFYRNRCRLIEKGLAPLFLRYSCALASVGSHSENESSTFKEPFNFKEHIVLFVRLGIN
jgi:hypothetical protein